MKLSKKVAAASQNKPSDVVAIISYDEKPAIQVYTPDRPSKSIVVAKVLHPLAIGPIPAIVPRIFRSIFQLLLRDVDLITSKGGIVREHDHGIG